MIIMTKNYVSHLRNLGNFDSIMNEIENLDLFNHPSQFSEMNDQLYDQYHLRVELVPDKDVPSANAYEIQDDYGGVVIRSEYSYGFASEAKIEGLVKIAKFIKANEMTPIAITEEIMDKTFKDYKSWKCVLPHYMKEKFNI